MSRKACERTANCPNMGNLSRHVEAFRYQLRSIPLVCVTCVAIAPPQGVRVVGGCIMPVELSPAAMLRHFHKLERGGSKSPCWGQTGRFETPVTTLLTRPTGLPIHLNEWNKSHVRVSRFSVRATVS